MQNRMFSEVTCDWLPITHQEDLTELTPNRQKDDPKHLAQITKKGGACFLQVFLSTWLLQTPRGLYEIAPHDPIFCLTQ